MVKCGLQLKTNVKARVLYSGSLSRMSDISQDTGQGRILVPFMYKVYINGLLNVLSNHCYATIVSGSSLSSPSFADDILLITLIFHPSFLQSFIWFRYSLQWRHEFNHTKSGAVTFGESNPLHSAAMQSRKWMSQMMLGDDIVDELYEYKNLGVLKNYAGSFSSTLMITSKRHRRRTVLFFHPTSIVVK